MIYILFNDNGIWYILIIGVVIWKKNKDKEIRNGGWNGGGWGVRGNIKIIIKWKINRIFIM